MSFCLLLSNFCVPPFFAEQTRNIIQQKIGDELPLVRPKQSLPSGNKLFPPVICVDAGSHVAVLRSPLFLCMLLLSHIPHGSCNQFRWWGIRLRLRYVEATLPVLSLATARAAFVSSCHRIHPPLQPSRQRRKTKENRPGHPKTAGSLCFTLSTQHFVTLDWTSDAR